MTTKNWIMVAESSFPWEREALEFVRTQFPNHDPYRAWTNFEFVADDGCIYEVDLLVFTPQGFFLIEIKSKPGRLRGDAGTWIWETTGDLYQDLSEAACKKFALLQTPDFVEEFILGRTLEPALNEFGVVISHWSIASNQ